MLRYPRRRIVKEKIKSTDLSYKLVSKTYRYYLHCRSRVHQIRQTRSLQKQFDTFDIIHIDPDEVTYKMPFWEEMHWTNHPGTIKGGEWDRDLPLYEESSLYESFLMHFEDSVSWTETPYFERIIGELDRADWHECTSRSELKKQLERYDSLYRDIEKYGYKSQLELIASNERERRLSPAETCEVLVNIDRNGDPILDDGRHRFTIAKLLDIDAIPVCVVVRHSNSL